MANERAAEVISCITSLVNGIPFPGIDGALLWLRAISVDVGYKGSYGEPPFSDPYLALVIDIFDSSGRMISTGYLDYMGTPEVPNTWTERL